jgi:hypothetical protein
MNSHKIITQDALGQFSKLKNTLCVAAFSRVFFSDWEEVIDCGYIEDNIDILNNWHSKNDGKFHEGKLNCEFLTQTTFSS